MHWVGYLEHESEELLGVYTANAGKGGYTIFAEIISQYYPWRCYQGLPWCATFVHGVFLQAYGKNTARKLLGKPHPGCRVLYRRMRRKGMLRGTEDVPCAGDLVFLAGVAHCGIVLKADEREVISVEGNTVDASGVFSSADGGAVAIRRRRRDDPIIDGYAAVKIDRKGGGCLWKN